MLGALLSDVKSYLAARTGNGGTMPPDIGVSLCRKQLQNRLARCADADGTIAVDRAPNNPEQAMSKHLGTFFIRPVAAVFLAYASLTGFAHAAPLTWSLDNVVFGDGTAVTGSFVFDAATQTFGTLSLTTTNSTVANTNTWLFNINNPDARQNGYNPITDSNVTGVQAVDALSADETGAHSISLFSFGSAGGLGPLLTDAGGVIPLDFLALGTCGDDICSFLDDASSLSLTGSGRFVSVVAQVPEPSSYALVFAGLLAAGALRRRRR